MSQASRLRGEKDAGDVARAQDAGNASQRHVRDAKLLQDIAQLGATGDGSILVAEVVGLSLGNGIQPGEGALIPETLALLR